MAHERFLVIGSNSFSGASFVARLLREDVDVVGVSRSPEPDPAMLPYRWIPHERFTFRQLDLNRDLEAIVELANEIRPEYIVNFAAQSMVPQSWAHPEHWFHTNTLALVKLCDRLRTCKFLRRFVQISTPEVYGSTSGLVSESAPFNPSTPYAISKAAGDMTLLAYHKAYGFPAAFTRAANVCGAGQQLYRIIPKTILCILTGQKLRLEGGGTSVRSFIDIRDVAEGTLRVARQGACGEVYHLATDRNQTIRELVEEICRQLGVRFADCVEVVPGRLGLDSAYLLDYTKARQTLGWTPQYSLTDILRDTIAWMQRYLDRLRTFPAEYIHKP